MLIIQMMLNRCIFSHFSFEIIHFAERIFNIATGVVRSYKRNFSLPLKDQAIEYEDVISNGR